MSNINHTKYPKQRLIVDNLKEFIGKSGNKTCPIAVMAGIRRIGKTTVLYCLQEYYGINNSLYLDFANDKEAVYKLDDFIRNPDKNLLLLDEITYLKNYENICSDLYNTAGGAREWKFKVVITGSSPAHLFKLAHLTLGGGRSKIFNLPVITFVEYLYFTERIKSYSEYSNATIQDFKDYLLLKDLNPELAMSFDEQYFIDYYELNDRSNDNRCAGRSFIELKSDDLQNMANLLAYQLADHVKYETIVSPDIGVRSLAPTDRARLIKFLLDSRITNCSTTLLSEDERKMEASAVYRELESTTNSSYLEGLFKKISVAMCSPLLYSRLGEDILASVNIDFHTLLDNSEYNDIIGKMLEVYIRGAIVQLDCPLIPFTLAKLKYAEIGEVDIWNSNRGILCEVTAGRTKGPQEIKLHKYFKNISLIRVCSTKHHSDKIEGFYRIPCPILCCMIDTGDIFNLDRTQI